MAEYKFVDVYDEEFPKALNGEIQVPKGEIWVDFDVVFPPDGGELLKFEYIVGTPNGNKFFGYAYPVNGKCFNTMFEEAEKDSLQKVLKELENG